MMTWLHQWRHRMAHRFGWNLGTLETWWASDGCLRAGIVCRLCGQVSNIVTIDKKHLLLTETDRAR
jgi:hypothetical protein